MIKPSLFISFGAGVLSFFSPCVLPLIPAYISFVSGLSLDKLRDEDSTVTKNVGRVFLETVLFVLGFSVVFIALGASATFLSSFLFTHQKSIKIIGGAIVIILGLHIAGVFNIKQLQYEKKVHLRMKPANLLGSFVVGIVFAVGWTPCVGPILAGILALAAAEQTLTHGILLLSLYSLGLAIPFLITSLFIGWSLGLFKKLQKHFRVVSAVSGALLVAVGIWMIVGGSL